MNRLWALAASIGLTSFAAVSPLHAQSNEDARTEARLLFEAGLKAMDEQRYDEACSKLARSQRLDPSIGTKYYLASCLEKQGVITSALTYYEEVSAEARALGQRDREAFAKRRADALAPKVPKLIILVPPKVRALEGAALALDGRPLNAGDLGVALPLDPGKHEVSVAAEGRSWAQTVELFPNGAAVELTIAPPPPPISPPPISPPPMAAPEAPKPGGSWAAASYSLLGLSGVTTAVGAVFAVKAAGLKGEYQAKPPEARTLDEYNDLRRTAVIADVILVSSLVVGAAGLISLIVMKASPKKPPPASLLVAPSSRGAQLAFTF